jgi:hypothetical protein
MGATMNKQLLAIFLLLTTLPVCAADVGGIFEQGSAQFSVLGGSGSAFNNNYLVIGAGANYYVADRVGVGLSYENWSGSSPGIQKISPSIQYVFHRLDYLQPYVGGFYRHSVITGQSGINSVGVRAGVYFPTGNKSVVGAGLAFESYLSCKSATYNSCNEAYPEVSFIIGF